MVEIGDLQIDFAQRHVEKDGVAIKVGGKALDILEVLFDADGKEVSKFDIIEKVWPHVFVEENNLQVHIAALRKILGGRRELIKTIPGRGYVLVPGQAQRHRTQPPASSTTTARPCFHAKLIGRDAEQRTIFDLLSRCRIVTLVGAGGIGKSSLARAVANAAHHRGVGRVLFIELADACSAHAVSDTMLSTLKLPPQADLLAAPEALDAIAAASDLLVLDNVEQVAEMVASLTDELVRRSPTLRVLVTSRQPLWLVGETLFRVKPLVAPGDGYDVEAIFACSAVTLFIERARASAPSFPVDAHSLAMVGEVCRRLDGLPLALELAALRVATLGLEFLANRLDDRLDLLTAGLRSALPRHQSLRATFDWSYTLLDPVAQRHFRRLAFFTNAFSFEDAYAVAGDCEMSAGKFALVLEELTTKSLISLHSLNGQPRYRLSECTRAYAIEKLRDEGELAAVQMRYAQYVRARKCHACAGSSPAERRSSLCASDPRLLP
ncbi:winged helix-turn-helix domain-containing protein [Burkholderia ubonensis]|uniref:winged helix-turn-helix domain-containing protein n=1 Tax=Burkholderia ubonensis TaxID=101571 RepID=UPI0012F744B4|nr:winged helix-turn-helix domain-containing protein [Burkholderia ubonensis]